MTFTDNAWDYNKGLSEQRMGLAPSQGGYRNKVFLMTKVDGRTKAVALREGIGVITMKPFGGSDGVILKRGAAIQPIDCLREVLNRPTSVVITGIDNDAALDQAFTATKSFSPMGETADQAGAGRFELFKTTDHFDWTAHHPDWLGGDTAETAALAPKNDG